MSFINLGYTPPASGGGGLTAEQATQLATAAADATAAKAAAQALRTDLPTARAARLDNLDLAISAIDALLDAIGLTLDGVDADVQTVMAATNKLNTALEQSGASWRFTAASLANTPATATVDLAPVTSALARLELEMKQSVEFERAANSVTGYFYTLNPDGTRDGRRRQITFASPTSGAIVRVGPALTYTP